MGISPIIRWKTEKSDDTISGGKDKDLFVYKTWNDIKNSLLRHWLLIAEFPFRFGSMSKCQKSWFHHWFRHFDVKKCKKNRISVITGTQTQIYSCDIDLFNDSNFVIDELQLNDISNISETNYSVRQFEHSTQSSLSIWREKITL